MSSSRKIFDRSSINFTTALHSTQIGATSPRLTAKRKMNSPPILSRRTMDRVGLGSLCYNRTLDPEVQADVQSNGLASRLLKYSKLDQDDDRRSPSRLKLTPIKAVAYNKPGEYPIVHLQKNEPRHMTRRSLSLSSVRIAPPEKTTFQPSSRTNILRSGSLHTLSSSPQSSAVETVDDARGDEPLAPHGDEIETSPTRSVLDALKEISRKRINSEELDAERAKKYCKEDTTDSVTTTVVTVVKSNGVSKRPREVGSSTSSPDRSSSNEQVRKRHCPKSNDIVSSLSSSVLLGETPKKPPEVVKPRARTLNVNVPPMPSVIRSVGQVPPQPMRHEILTPEMVAARLPPPKLPVINVPKVQPKPVVVPPPQPPPSKVTLFNRKMETKGLANEDEDGAIRFIKPVDTSPQLNAASETLRKVEKSKLALMLSCLHGEEEEDEVDKGKKVEEKKAKEEPPKKEEAKPVEDAPKVPEEVKEPIKETPVKLVEAPSINFSVQKTTTSAESTPATSIVTSSTPNFSFGLSPATKLQLPTPIKPVVSETPAVPVMSVPSQPLPPPVQQPPPAPAVVTTAEAKLVEAPSFTFGVANSPAPAATSANFSFGLSPATKNVLPTPLKPVVEVQKVDAAPKFSFASGNFSNLPVSTPSFAMPKVSEPPKPVFESPKLIAEPPKPAFELPKSAFEAPSKPTTGGFSFNAAPTSSTTGFSFTGIKPTAATASEAPAKTIFSRLGPPTTSPSTTPATNATQSPSKHLFTFGPSNTAAAPASAEAKASSFSFVAAAAASNPPAAAATTKTSSPSTFSFTAAAAASGTNPAANAFKFGNSATPATTTAAPSTGGAFKFGGDSSNTSGGAFKFNTSAPAFSFTGAQNASQAENKPFSSPSPASSSAFVFGGGSSSDVGLNSSSTATPGPSIFGGATQSPQRRPIRQAIRRLNK